MKLNICEIIYGFEIWKNENNNESAIDNLIRLYFLDLKWDIKDNEYLKIIDKAEQIIKECYGVE